MTIRTDVLIPPGLADDVAQLLDENKVAEARELCENDPSVLAYVLLGGLQETDLSWEEVEKGAENAAAEQTARLFRKIDFLNDIGTIAPMIGLLGTVIGMLMAFRELAATDGTARAPELAGGIYLALITTVQGLMVAIPSLAVYSFFRNRVSFLIAEIAFISDQVFRPVKVRMLRGQKTEKNRS